MKTEKKNQGSKPKMTKEERRAKYTKIARDRQAKQWAKSRNSRTTCYHCRKQGHAVAQCPELNASSSKEVRQENAQKICFKCGSIEHGLYQCPKLKHKNDTDLPFASCFVCHQKGHLAKHCEQNTKGIYVNGGCCKNCGSNQHRATECPNKKKSKTSERGDEPVPEELLQEVPETKKEEPVSKKKRKVVNF